MEGHRAVRILVVTACSLALTTGGWAQSPPAAPGTSAPTKERTDKGMASGDQRFIREAASGGTMEVELGKLAESKASSDAVKQFGRRMVEDHGKANQELMRLAQTKGISLPAEPDQKHAQLRDRLAKLSGPAFDRAYVREMVKDHEKDVAAFRSASQRAKDTELKSWAAKTLPTLEDHLRSIQGFRAQVGTSPRPAASSGSATPPTR
jgi:putative membrane protein